MWCNKSNGGTFFQELREIRQQKCRKKTRFSSISFITFDCMRWSSSMNKVSFWSLQNPCWCAHHMNLYGSYITWEREKEITPSCLYLFSKYLIKKENLPYKLYLIQLPCWFVSGIGHNHFINQYNVYSLRYKSECSP